MKSTLWFGLIFGILLEISADQRGYSFSKDCADDYVWCPHQKMHCSTSYMKKYCKLSCGECKSEANDYNEECFSLGCEDRCEMDDEATAMRCTCSDGFVLNSDGRSCSDVNECEGSNPCTDPRNPVCVNYVGSYECSTCRALHNHTNYYKSNSCCMRTGPTGCGQNSKTGMHAPSGLNAILGLWPWTALVQVRGRACTGVLISNDWVLAPAHCFSSRTTVSDVTVAVGVRSDDSRDANHHSHRYNVDQVVVHGSYDFPNNDIALLHLSGDIRRSWAVRPICLPNGEVPVQGAKCWMSGFETFFGNDGVVRHLVDSGVTLARDRHCLQKRNARNLADPDHLLCGRYDRTVEPTCPGEIGGAMVCQRCSSCDWYVAGIMSFGDSCTERNGRFHAGFVSIESYENWIYQRTGISINKNKSCSSNNQKWRPWSDWTQCTRSCGGGRQERSRVCVNDEGCSGDTEETRSCNTAVCSNWSDFNQWSVCSASCGSGMRRRSRTCVNGTIGQVGCPEEGREETEECDGGPCSHWSKWSSWNSCSRSCGSPSTQSCNRECIGGDVESDGCRGSRKRYRDCHQAPCPTWSKWSSWSSCSETCGENSQKVSRRTCLHGGSCVGQKTRTKKCELKSCSQSRCQKRKDIFHNCSRNKNWCRNYMAYRTVWCSRTCCSLGIV